MRKLFALAAIAFLSLSGAAFAADSSANHDSPSKKYIVIDTRDPAVRNDMRHYASFQEKNVLDLADPTVRNDMRHFPEQYRQ